MPMQTTLFHFFPAKNFLVQAVNRSLWSQQKCPNLVNMSLPATITIIINVQYTAVLNDILECSYNQDFIFLENSIHVVLARECSMSMDPEVDPVLGKVSTCTNTSSTINCTIM